MKISVLGFWFASAEEDSVHTATIVASGTGDVWVGLYTFKQEYWMRDHVDRMLGAARDFYAGDVKRAPDWMHHSGLERLYWLTSELRRMWRRYLVLAPKFVLIGERPDFCCGI